MKLDTVIILLSIGMIADARPKSSRSTDGGVAVNEIPSHTGSRPRIEQPYNRHTSAGLEKLSGEGQHCRKPAKCLQMKNTSNICLTTKLPYLHTSLELVSDSIGSLDDVQVKQDLF